MTLRSVGPGVSLKTDFTMSNNIFTGVVKTLRKKGLNTTVHHASTSEDDFKVSTMFGKCIFFWLRLGYHRVVKKSI